MSKEEKAEKIKFIYEISTKFGRVVHNVENWSNDDIDYEFEELEELLAPEEV